MTILPFLTTRPQTKKALAERMGIPQREVESLINAARHEGHPILSDGDGYRITTDPAEVRTMAARLHRRSTHVHETARALEATAERMAAEQAAALQPAGTLWGRP